MTDRTTNRPTERPRDGYEGSSKNYPIRASIYLCCRGIRSGRPPVEVFFALGLEGGRRAEGEVGGRTDGEGGGGGVGRAIGDSPGS